MGIKKWFADAFQPQRLQVSVSQLSKYDRYRPSASGTGSYVHAWDDGSKFSGGFGNTQVLTPDYWTLRARSIQLFETNLYARGLVRRLITNVINTGLHLEATPEESILGVPEDSLSDWSEMVENRFALWGDNPDLCDLTGSRTWGALQESIYLEAMIAGDVLVVLRQDPVTMLPRIQIIPGDRIMSPFGVPPIADNNIIQYGIELDGSNRQVAYWVLQDSGKVARLDAFGGDTGRRSAWMVYATDKREGDVRGKPLLSLILQSLREVDRYRDSAQRKAVINSMIAMFITKEADKPGTRPLTMGATRRETATVVDGDGTTRERKIRDFIPGMVIEELQQGEKPQGFSSQGIDEKFGEFEEAIIQAIAWSEEIPPEILRLSFSSNYSASQAAINELKMFLNRARYRFASQVCKPVYHEWLISEVFLNKIVAPGLSDAFRDARKYDQMGAWISSDWTGHIKPAVDLSKLVKGYTEMVDQGFITRDRAARELTGTKYSKNVQKLARENQALADANSSLVAQQLPVGQSLPESDTDPNEDDERDDGDNRGNRGAETLTKVV